MQGGFAEFLDEQLDKLKVVILTEHVRKLRQPIDVTDYTHSPPQYSSEEDCAFAITSHDVGKYAGSSIDKKDHHLHQQLKFDCSQVVASQCVGFNVPEKNSQVSSTKVTIPPLPARLDGPNFFNGGTSGALHPIPMASALRRPTTLNNGRETMVSQLARRMTQQVPQTQVSQAPNMAMPPSALSSSRRPSLCVPTSYSRRASVATVANVEIISEQGSDISDDDTASNSGGLADTRRDSKLSKVSKVSRTSRKSHDVMSVISGTTTCTKLDSVKNSAKLLPGWELADMHANMAKNRMSNALNSLISEGCPQDTRKQDSGGFSRFIIQPKGWKRLVWDWLCMLLTSYDALVVPLQFLESDTDDDGFFSIMAWLTRFFWTVDIAVSCITGYTARNGEVEMRPAKIVRHYARGWMPFDVTLVAADWLQELLTEIMATAGRMSTRLARAARLVRLVRLTRILRLANTIAIMLENVNLSEQLSIVSNITLSIVGIFGFCHLVACMWYAVGAESDSGWPNTSGVDAEPLSTRYTVSLYWAVSTVTGSSPLLEHGGPSSQGERVFCVLTLFFSFVLVACFVSSFTSALTKFHFISQSVSSKISVLRQFMKQRQISPKLTARILRNASFLLLQQQRKTPEQEVHLLQLVSQPLKIELHFEERSWVLLQHPLFARLCISDVASVKKICHSATSIVPFCRGDVLFQTGESPAMPMMLFLHDGECQYIDEQKAEFKQIETLVKFEDDNDSTDSQLESSIGVVRVKPGEFVGEPALWTRWVYHGLLRARCDGQVLSLDGEMFQKISAHCPTFNVATYAAAYVEQLNTPPLKASELSDVVDIKEIVDRVYGPIRRAGEKMLGPLAVNMFQARGKKASIIAGGNAASIHPCPPSDVPAMILPEPVHAVD